MGEFNPDEYRKDFPLISGERGERPVIYLDNGATTQKPRQVIQRLEKYYFDQNANVHRGAYHLSELATQEYEGVREKVCRLLGTKKTKEVIYTKGTTDSINLVAAAWGRKHLTSGDTVLVTRMDHHSNFVPWQAIARQTGAEFKIVELTSDFRLDLDHLETLLKENRVKLLALPAMSNVLGTINPIKKIAALAQCFDTRVVVDAAQAVAHYPISLPEWEGVDAFAFSSHKLYGPTGTGVLWAKEEFLNSMDPYQFGGDMILHVQDQETIWNELPWRFEAGTPNIAGVIGMGAAIDYLLEIGLDRIDQYEHELGKYLLEKLSSLEGLKVLGPSEMVDRGGSVSFWIEGVHPHDLSTFLDQHQLAIRAGHHCAQPLHAKYGITASARASIAFYNTRSEIDLLVESISAAIQYFKG